MLPLFLIAHAIFPVLWLAAILNNGPTASDWRHLKIVADHFVAGDWDRLYAVGDDAINPGYFWRYPPFALYVVAPLAWVPEVWAYALLAGKEVAALALSLWLLRRLEPFCHKRAEWVLAIALSAPALTTVVTGQSSALMLLCVTGAAMLWTRGHNVGACAVLGLLALKPNWGIVFGLLALAKREWKGAMAMAGVALFLCLIALPLGLPVWSDFFAASLTDAAVLERYPPQKLITLRSFLEWSLGTGKVASTVWALAAAGLLGTAFVAWRVPGSPLRQLGIALLLAVAANPYASFYDALVLAVPATVWWAERDEWPRRPWVVVGLLLALAWCTEQWLYSWGVVATAAGLHWLPPVSIVGPVAAIWLVLAAAQAVQQHTRQLHSYDG